LDDGELLWELLNEIEDKVALPTSCSSKPATLNHSCMNELMNYFSDKFFLTTNRIEMKDIIRGDMDIFDSFLWPVFYNSQFQGIH
jgi:hypothetical protein